MATTKTCSLILQTICLLAALQGIAPAKDQYRIDVWTADNGLPQNIIVGICQTPDSYLWLATLDGLARFDGVRFTVFDKSNSPGIESNRFTALACQNGDLWLSTEGSGVTRYRKGVFTTYTTQDGLPYNSVRALTGDASGNLWVLANDTIAQWNEAAGRFIDITPRNLKVPLDHFFWEGGGFWGADGVRLYCFVAGRVATYQLPRWLPGPAIRFVTAGQDGTIWLETNNGVRGRIVQGQVRPESAEALTTYHDRNGNTWTIGVGRELARYVTYSANGEEKRFSFKSLSDDREGNLWLATVSQGLCRVRRQFITGYSKEQGLVARNVYPVFQDHRGAVWIGAWGGGISRLEGGRITNYTEKDGLASSFANAIEEDREGRLWVATHGGGLQIFRGGRFRTPAGPMIPEHATVSAIHQDREGTLWFGTSRGLVQYKDGASRLFTAKNGLAADDVRVIVDGDEGELWIGSFGGLTRLQAGCFTHWTERDGLPSNTVRAIYYDSDGVLWIGTYDGGLGRFQKGRFTRYTTREGLFDNGVFQILEDDRGNFWMSSNRGIYRVSKGELNQFAAGRRTEITSVNYGRSDGMFNVECNGGSSRAGIRGRDGNLWFPTQDGVAVIDPLAIPSNTQPPPVQIETCLVDRVPAPLDRPVRITPDKTSFEIQYTALSFIDSEQIRFQYRLANLDSAWIDAGTRRAASYSHVPPGHYLFTVIARNRDGVWNRQGRSLEITVLPPYYRTWWFEALAILAAGSLAWAAWRYRISQLEREHDIQRAFSRQLIASQEDERKRIAAELHDSLGQRLVVVKNLASFYLRAQGGATDDKLSQIEEISAEASRAINETREIAYNLRPFKLDQLGLTKAIEGMLRTTSAASGIRFSSQLENIDEVFAEELRINFYRIVQESLNNIVKHAEATETSIAIERRSEGVVLVIRDNGRGFTPGSGNSGSTPSGFGLTGMAERAQLLGGVLTVQAAPGRGTVVRAEFPLRRESSG